MRMDRGTEAHPRRRVGAGQRIFRLATDALAVLGGLVLLAFLIFLVRLDASWPAAGFVDTEIGCFMKPEVADAATEVFAGVQG
ncbi:hypothetical protein, partial [Prosthecomicrobium pneumaticum]|uniref:hypothetical protein n=1 Tax=Prosthecomicrobium pneumaticum TaxID=81895 RepID=UPI001AED2242